MSLIGKLIGSDKALDKVVDTAKGLLDEAFYTKEEQAADKAIAREKAQGMVIEWMQATTGSRLARRVIAFAITGTWLGLKLLGTTISMSSVWAGTINSERLLTTAKISEVSASDMTGAVMLILGFYFAAPYMGELAQSALQQFGKRNQ